MRSSWIIALALVAAGRAAAVERLSLADAVRLAARDNPTIVASAIDVDIAAAHVREAAGIDDLTFSASASYQRDENLFYGSLGTPQVPYDLFSASAKLTQPLPTGGRLSLRFGSDTAWFRYPPDSTPTATATAADSGGVTTSGGTALTPPNDPPRWFAPSLQLELTQPLMRGAGAKVARAERRRALVARDVALLQRQATVARVLADVSAAYWDLYYAGAQRDIARSSLALAEQQLQAVQAAIDTGKESPSAAAEVEVAIALRQAQAIGAEQDVRQSSVTLERLLGRAIGPGQPPLVPADAPRPSDVAVDAEPLLAAAMQHNPELAKLQQQERLTQIEVDVTDNGLLPALDLTVSGGPRGNAPAPGDAFGQLGRFDGYAAFASLTLTEPIQRRAERGAAARTRATRRRVFVSENELTAQIRAAVWDAVGLVEAAAQRSRVLERGTRAAQLDLDAARARFEAGRATNFDVLRRQDGLATAQLREVQARTDYEKARVTVETLTNDILDHYGVAAR